MDSFKPDGFENYHYNFIINANEPYGRPDATRLRVALFAGDRPYGEYSYFIGMIRGQWRIFGHGREVFAWPVGTDKHSLYEKLPGIFRGEAYKLSYERTVPTMYFNFLRSKSV